MTRLLLVLSLSLALPRPAAADAPDWVVKGSFKEGPRLMAVGSGRSLEAALLSALTQAAGLLGSKGAEYERSFGPVLLKHKASDNLSSASHAGSKQVVKTTTEALLTRGRKRYALVLRETSRTEGEESLERAELETEASGLGLADLISILADQGWALRDWRDPADYTQYAALERGGTKAP